METSEASSIKSDSQCGWTDSVNCQSYCGEGGSQDNDETGSESDGSSTDGEEDESENEEGSGDLDSTPDLGLG